MRRRALAGSRTAVGRKAVSCRSGFTLLETVLAAIVGSMVIIACTGLFFAVQRADESFAKRAASVTEFASTQRTLRRALLGLVMMPAGDRPDPREVEQAIADGQEPPSPDEWPMARMIIEADPSPSIQAMVAAAAADGAELPVLRSNVAVETEGEVIVGPQRLEVVLERQPVPPGLGLASRSWARVSLADAQVGATVGVAETGAVLDPGVRGVFDLRPDGFRERIIAGLGLVPATSLGPGFGVDEAGNRFAPRVLSEVATGWTLWWRPVYWEERAARDRGIEFDVDQFPELLVEAVPLVHGLSQCNFTAFALDRELGEGMRFNEFVSHASRDLPGYMEVELKTVSGHYANWMFEVGWQVADEGVNESAEIEEDEDDAGGGGGDIPAELQGLAGAAQAGGGRPSGDGAGGGSGRGSDRGSGRGPGGGPGGGGPRDGGGGGERP